jgi:Uma2 family endonuclease
MTFDRGILEIMSPTTEHEEYNRTIASLVEVVAEEMDVEFRNLGSTTYKRADMLRGFEPDSSSTFKVSWESLVRPTLI